jgi:hypothetical protein
MPRNFQISYPYATHCEEVKEATGNPTNIAFSKITLYMNDAVVTRTNSHNRKNLSSTDVITHHENPLKKQPSAIVQRPTSFMIFQNLIPQSPRAPSELVESTSPLLLSPLSQHAKA